MRIMNPLFTMLFGFCIFFIQNISLATGLPVPAAPKISAKSYILQDYNSGKVLAEMHANSRVEPASITKLMTAYVVFGELKAGRLQLTDEVTISKKAWRMPGSRTFVEVNSKVPVEILLKGIIVQSGNDATVALAEHIAGGEDTFVSLMNQYAQKMGLSGTHFVNTTGLPHPQHYSTAQDIATLSQHVIREYPEYYAYYALKQFNYNDIPQYNRNKLLRRDPSVDGIKTGHTESAGYCLASSAKRGDMRLIAVVLGDKSEEARASSSSALLNYGFTFYESRKLYQTGQNLKNIRVWKGDKEILGLGLNEDLYITYPTGNYNKLKATIDILPEITAPVVQGQKLGTLNISLDKVIIAEAPLVALQAVAEGGFWSRSIDGIKLWFK